MNTLHVMHLCKLTETTSSTARKHGEYGHAPHNDASVIDGLHIQWQSHNVIIKYNNTVRSESRCALRLRYVDLVVSTEAHFMSSKLQ
jgi:hypothetical protein